MKGVKNTKKMNNTGSGGLFDYSVYSWPRFYQIFKFPALKSLLVGCGGVGWWSMNFLIPVADKQTQTGRTSVSKEDGNGDGGEDNDGANHVQGEAQPPGPALEHDAGPRVVVNLVAELTNKLGLDSK